MDLKLLMTLLPLLQKSGVAMIGISTKKSSVFDLFTVLMKKRFPDGTPVFRTFEWKGVCEACEKKGEEVTCEHKRGERPWWLETDDGGFMKQVMSDFYEDYMREMKGVEGSAQQKKVFRSEDVNFLQTREAEVQSLDGTFDYFFTSVDPAAGGNNSEYAIISMVFDGHKATVSILIVLTKQRDEVAVVVRVTPPVVVLHRRRRLQKATEARCRNRRELELADLPTEDQFVQSSASGVGVRAHHERDERTLHVDFARSHLPQRLEVAVLRSQCR